LDALNFRLNLVSWPSFFTKGLLVSEP